MMTVCNLQYSIWFLGCSLSWIDRRLIPYVDDDDAVWVVSRSVMSCVIRQSCEIERGGRRRVPSPPPPS
jgi:hypothetical protein